VLSATRRHLSDTAALSFVEPMGTRRLPAGSGVVVARGELRDLERKGGFCLSWQSGTQRYGLSVSVLARLSEGETVVVGSDVDIASEARAIWPDVSVIRLMAGTDRVRAGLSPRACFTRIAGRDLPERGKFRFGDERLAGLVHDGGDLSNTVRALAAMLTSLAPVPTVARTTAAAMVALDASPRPQRLSRRSLAARSAVTGDHKPPLADMLARPRERL
jgi:ribose 1,5-bisphosphokinase PhnN